LSVLKLKGRSPGMGWGVINVKIAYFINAHKNFGQLERLMKKLSRWTISYDCAGYILAFTKKNQRFIDFFKLCHIPDEMFFHTIIMNSPYKPKVFNDNLRYVDWAEAKPNPKILTRDDLPKLLASEKLFARKFDTSVDTEVQDLIDNCS
jgi:hypothetical protein